MPANKVEQIKLYILMGTCLFAAIVAYFQFFHEKHKPAAGPAPVYTAPVALPALPQAKIGNQEKASVTSPLPTEGSDAPVRDIFSPPRWSGKEKKRIDVQERPKPRPAPRMVLSGTMVGGGAYLAVINNRLYKVGETIEGYRIVKIAQNKVLLKSGGREIVLQVMSAGIQ